MMSKNKIGLQFDGFEEYAEQFEKLGGDLKEITQKALQSTHDYITPNLHKSMDKHNRTGDTERSIVDDAKVQWEGLTASIDIGFDLGNKGLPSIFLMYGTPRMKKDQTLYNDIYGTKTKKAIKELQEKIFSDAIKNRMGG